LCEESSLAVAFGTTAAIIIVVVVIALVATIAAALTVCRSVIGVGLVFHFLRHFCVGVMGVVQK